MTEHHRVLLTGATGALGPALAAELLASNPNRTLDVLVRPGTGTVDSRFNDWLGSLPALIRARQRIRPVAGDVRVDRLGLSAGNEQELSKSIDCIVHAAADTQFLNSLDDMRNTNVEGTRRVIELARASRRNPRLVLVSTVCTSGMRTGRIEEASHSTPPDFVNNYERTKWESERLAMSAKLPLGIARVSIVMGSDADGLVHRPGALHHMLKWFARGLLPVIPGTDRTRIDLICTEMVARFISRAVEARWESGSIWHVAAGDDAALLSEMAKVCFAELRDCQAVQDLDHPSQPFIVAPEIFDQVRLSKTSPRQRLVRQAMDSINSFMPGLSYPRTYDTTRAQRLWGGPLPCPDWRRTLVAVLRAGSASRARKVA
jgi:thioester reductase-like protein